MARLEVESTPLDMGHYGFTHYYCSECHKDCEGYVKKCPHCHVEFDEESTLKMGSDFGGSDF